MVFQHFPLVPKNIFWNWSPHGTLPAWTGEGGGRPNRLSSTIDGNVEYLQLYLRQLNLNVSDKT